MYEIQTKMIVFGKGLSIKPLTGPANVQHIMVTKSSLLTSLGTATYSMV